MRAIGPGRRPLVDAGRTVAFMVTTGDGPGHSG